jgi:hypothetical protein
MKTRFLLLLTVIVFAGFFSGCTPKAKYERMVKHELASGIRNDSIFMGIYLGMAEKDFYTRCWILNSQGLIKQSPRNMSVEYQMNEELKSKATMDFYPAFVDGKIYEMPVRFIYNGWAPWNNALSADSLQIDVLNWFKELYGDNFIDVKHPTRGDAYVMVNGNRRISIFKENEMYVWAIYTDLLVQSHISDTTSKVGEIQKEISRKLEK